MTEVAAAMGLTSLESIEHFVAVNRLNYAAYQEGLAGLPGVRLLSYPAGERINRQYIVLEIDAAQTGISRDHLYHVLLRENVVAKRYFRPGCHQMTAYRDGNPARNRSLPVTERLVEEVLCLPTGTGVTASDIIAICDIIRLAVTHGHELSRRLEIAQYPVQAAD
jgi:dTDP-4-amino-4,6-dideoxygalactose transaminase